MEPGAETQIELARKINDAILNDGPTDGKILKAYTWIYRWEDPREFHFKTSEYVQTARKSIFYKPDEKKKYLNFILNNNPYIIVHHRAGPSKIKACNDIDHFHMITWHSDHPTSQHSFMMLKKLMATKTKNEYSMKCQRVYNPYGLCKYLTQDGEIRRVVCCGNLSTKWQLTMLRQLTEKKPMNETGKDSESEEEVYTTKTTVRGQKYEFIKKLMQKCNSTDIGDIITDCKSKAGESRKYNERWTDIFKNTPNINTIVAAAATDVNIEAKVTPIWEQLHEKRELFNNDKNRYWSIVQSLNILEEWCRYHNFDIEKFAKETFEICHKIKAKINCFHITGVSNSGKSYVPRSLRNGLMNCGRMRCQASDSFTFGTCVDKTLIYTDEMWFTPQNVEEAKCILEGTETYVNVKHQNERLLRRTPCISTSNNEPWKVVLQEREAIMNRMYHYETTRPMPQLKRWGVIELNPVMWLTVWKRQIDKFANNEYHKLVNDEDKPSPPEAKTLQYEEWDNMSPKNRKRINRVKRNLTRELMDEPEECRYDEDQPGQYCATHQRPMTDCYYVPKKKWRGL